MIFPFVWSCGTYALYVERDSESVAMGAAKTTQRSSAKCVLSSVRSQERLVKKGGALASSSLADFEFRVASGDTLENLANKAQFRRA